MLPQLQLGAPGRNTPASQRTCTASLLWLPSAHLMAAHLKACSGSLPLRHLGTRGGQSQICGPVKTLKEASL